MSEFSDRPFVAGSLSGIRSFEVDSLGRLRGVTVSRVFKPGVNEATCTKRLSTVDFLPRGRYGLPLDTSDEAFRAAEKEARKHRENHRVAGVGCGCGYYAYFDGSNDYSSSKTVTAIIAGAGVCTVGTRGFRAEKAELVALVGPSWRDQPAGRFVRRWGWAANAFLAVMLAFFVLQRGLAHDWVICGIDAVLTLANAGLAINGFRKRPRGAADARFELLARNYPGVPFYPSLKAARNAHPVAPPPLPSPEDDDFWTREVSS